MDSQTQLILTLVNNIGKQYNVSIDEESVKDYMNGLPLYKHTLTFSDFGEDDWQIPDDENNERYVRICSSSVQDPGMFCDELAQEMLYWCIPAEIVYHVSEFCSVMETTKNVLLSSESVEKYKHFGGVSIQLTKSNLTVDPSILDVVTDTCLRKVRAHVRRRCTEDGCDYVNIDAVYINGKKLKLTEVIVT